MGMGGQPHASAASTPSKHPVSILQEARWALRPVWTGGKSRPHQDSIPDHPARSQSLYRVSNPAHPKYQISRKIRPVGAELFHMDRETDGRGDGHDEATSRNSQFCERARQLTSVRL